MGYMKTALEVYVIAITEFHIAEKKEELAHNTTSRLRNEYQNAWRKVAAFRNQGNLKPGLYKVRDLCVVIPPIGDYPEPVAEYEIKEDA